MEGLEIPALWMHKPQETHDSVEESSEGVDSIQLLLFLVFTFPS